MHEFHAPYGVYRDTAGEPFTMGDDAKRLRRFFEDYFIEHGYGPDMTDITTALGLSQHDTWEALYQLERGVQVMFLPGTETLVKMPPFSYAPTRHRVSVGDHRRWYAGCAGESCAINALFPGRQVTVTSTCPECWQPMTFVFLDRELVSADPPEAVVHIGVHPHRFRDDWIVTCDSINFFPSLEHVARWEQAVPQRRGVTMPVALGPKWVDGVARTRYWDYDRGPDVADGDAMIESFGNMGLDVSPWQ